jgi:hypothetical protein
MRKFTPEASRPMTSRCFDAVEIYGEIIPCFIFGPATHPEPANE